MAIVNESFLSEQPVSITHSQTCSSAPTRFKWYFNIHITGKQSILIHCNIKISHIRQLMWLNREWLWTCLFHSSVIEHSLTPTQTVFQKEAESHYIEKMCKWKYALCGACCKFHIITSLEFFHKKYLSSRSRRACVKLVLNRTQYYATEMCMSTSNSGQEEWKQGWHHKQN